MREPGAEPDYSIDVETLRRGVQAYLVPVIDDLVAVSDNYTGGHADVASAHANQTPGWFGGEGNGDVRTVTSSFLNEATWQLQQLAADQVDLLASLRDYEKFLTAHAQWAETTELKIAGSFQAIERDLLDRRGR